MNKVFILICVGIAVAVGLSSLVAYVIVRGATPKIAFIRTNELIMNYAGMKDARALIEDKRSRLQQGLDTLESSYNSVVADYNGKYNSMSVSDRQEREKFIQAQQNNLYQYSQATKQKHEEEERKITEGVVNQINSYVKQYAEEHKHTIVFGTTSEGSIMYGEDAIDITKDVLEYLNKTYKK